MFTRKAFMKPCFLLIVCTLPQLGQSAEIEQDVPDPDFKNNVDYAAWLRKVLKVPEDQNAYVNLRDKYHLSSVEKKPYILRDLGEKINELIRNPEPWRPENKEIIASWLVKKAEPAIQDYAEYSSLKYFRPQPLTIDKPPFVSLLLPYLDFCRHITDGSIVASWQEGNITATRFDRYHRIAWSMTDQLRNNPFIIDWILAHKDKKNILESYITAFQHNIVTRQQLVAFLEDIAKNNQHDLRLKLTDIFKMNLWQEYIILQYLVAPPQWYYPKAYFSEEKLRELNDVIRPQPLTEREIELMTEASPLKTVETRQWLYEQLKQLDLTPWSEEFDLRIGLLMINPNLVRNTIPSITNRFFAELGDYIQSIYLLYQIEAFRRSHITLLRLLKYTNLGKEGCKADVLLEIKKSLYLSFDPLSPGEYFILEKKDNYLVLRSKHYEKEQEPKLHRFPEEGIYWKFPITVTDSPTTQPKGAESPGAKAGEYLLRD